MFNCPNRTAPGAQAANKALFGGHECPDVAWNEHSHKYLRWGRVEGKSARMLVDTGCDTTMVSARWIPPSRVEWAHTALVQCVHGDSLEYPTARVKLRVGGVDKLVRVVVAPKLPIPVLLGRDVTGEEPPVLPSTREEPPVLPVLPSARKEQPTAGEEQLLVLPEELPSAREVLAVLPFTRDDVPEVLEVEHSPVICAVGEQRGLAAVTRAQAKRQAVQQLTGETERDEQCVPLDPDSETVMQMSESVPYSARRADSPVLDGHP